MILHMRDMKHWQVTRERIVGALLAISLVIDLALVSYISQVTR
jgi:hypothetical protein